jgi:hypothetical protein
MNILTLFFLLLIACVITLIIINTKTTTSFGQPNEYDYIDSNENNNNDDSDENNNNDDSNENNNNNNDDSNENNNNDGDDYDDIDSNENNNNDDGKEVFNISKNIYTYGDAKNVCKAFGSELATYQQLQNEFLKGADWCNYGWSQDQKAYYPTQKSSWDKIQSDPSMLNKCGHPGINGGFFADTELKFGVNCYGTKPKQTNTNDDDSYNDMLNDVNNGGSNPEVDKYKKDKKNIKMLPFNNNHWSMYETTSRNFINDI